ncbi:MAG TPA: hypothetical protein ENK88_08800, partial [Campylobacterales bacterium]|nr:hypothetical protein [Campylobacterales bacterium]
MLDNPSYIIDTFFAIFAMTLIIFMVPGFAMLEAGLVRTKNVTSLDLIRHIRKNEVMYKAQAALISCFIKIPLAALISLSTTIFSSLIVFLPPS